MHRSNALGSARRDQGWRYAATSGKQDSINRRRGTPLPRQRRAQTPVLTVQESVRAKRQSSSRRSRSLSMRSGQRGTKPYTPRRSKERRCVNSPKRVSCRSTESARRSRAAHSEVAACPHVSRSLRDELGLSHTSDLRWAYEASSLASLHHSPVFERCSTKAAESAR